MRVLFVATRLHPKLGGVERHVESVRLALNAEGVQVSLFENGHRLAALGRILRLRKFINHGNFDVVHAHDFAPAFCAWLAMCNLHKRPKLFLTTHGYEGFPLRLHYVLAHRLAHKIAIAAIAIGGYIDKWYGTRSNLILHGGIDPLVASRTHDTVAFVSRLASDTNATEVAAAMLDAAPSNPGLKFEIYGFGPLEDEVKKILSAGRLVTFHGATDRPGQVFARSVVVIANSYLAILEALQAGALVIAVADNPLKQDYIDEIVSASGAVFSCTIPDLSSTLSRLVTLSDQERSSLVRKGRDYSTRMTWGNVARDYLGVWERRCE